jgi:catechol 2,3-dioxygenase-like lactoylglutathione lyase family enzyme
MIDLFDIRYVRMGTKDLESTTRFMTEIIGLECVRKVEVPG